MDEKKKKMIEIYNIAIDKYFNREFEEAAKLFKNVLEIEPDDYVSEIHLARCLEYIKNPPGDDWDGVFKLTSK
ncbi:MAG: tetratricopeptide repeat protein [Spirochaetes bacterium]|nr:tetratricopeptide repeat protein [Spirochaetota bacterium]